VVLKTYGFEIMSIKYESVLCEYVSMRMYPKVSELSR